MENADFKVEDASSKALDALVGLRIHPLKLNMQRSKHPMMHLVKTTSMAIKDNYICHWLPQLLKLILEKQNIFYAPL